MISSVHCANVLCENDFILLNVCITSHIILFSSSFPDIFLSLQIYLYFQFISLFGRLRIHNKGIAFSFALLVITHNMSLSHLFYICISMTRRFAITNSSGMVSCPSYQLGSFSRVEIPKAMRSINE